jgi:antitoxin HicB
MPKIRRQNLSPALWKSKCQCGSHLDRINERQTSADQLESGCSIAKQLPTAKLPGVKFRVTIEPDEDGVFVAECPALPGCVSQGKTRDEAMTNIRDAIQGYLESLKKHGEPIPGPITEAVVEVTV